MKRRVLSKTTPFHIYIKKKKGKTRTVSFWTTLFIFLLPPELAATGDENFQKKSSCLSLSSPPPPPNASMADQPLRDWRRTNKRHTCSVLFSINREDRRGRKEKKKNAEEREEGERTQERKEKRDNARKKGDSRNKPKTKKLNPKTEKNRRESHQKQVSLAAVRTATAPSRATVHEPRHRSASKPSSPSR